MTFNKSDKIKQATGEIINEQKKNLLHWIAETQDQKQVSEQSSSQKLRQQQIVILQNGEALYYRPENFNKLMGNQIYTKMIGINSSSKNINYFVCEPYVVDKYACAFIVKHNIFGYNQHISNQKGVELIKQLQKNLVFFVYQHMVFQRKLFLIDGHKFGGEFLAYEHNPDSNHATYLIFIKNAETQINMDHISRLAGISKKQALIASITYKKQDQSVLINCQQLQPRFPETKKHVPPPKGTHQLLRLKQLIWNK